MSIHLESKDLVNTQQMEVAVHGPDGATHLILCTGVANLDAVGQETYTFFVGPVLSQRQFVGVIASGAISTVHRAERQPSQPLKDLEEFTSLVLVTADYDQESRQVRVKADVPSLADIRKLAISYNVSILAELQRY